MVVIVVMAKVVLAASLLCDDLVDYRAEVALSCHII